MRRALVPAGLVQALSVGLAKVDHLAGDVAIDNFLPVHGSPPPDVRCLQMRPHDGHARKAVARCTGLAGILESARSDKPLQGSPDRR